MTGSAIFLDTSIQVARFFHAPQLRMKIEARIAEFDICATSLVVKQEYKRRVLKEAKYLLTLFQRRGSFNEVRRWVDSVLPPRSNRKRNICIDLLDTICERVDVKETDREKADRAMRLLEVLLEYGLTDFDNSVDHIFNSSGCACARQPVRIDSDGRVSLGTDKCSQVANDCGIAAFLRQNSGLLKVIRDALNKASPSELTEELRHSKVFIDYVLSNPSDVESTDPCTKVGDLLVALESQTVNTFYTLNEKESGMLCPCLGQTLIVRPKNYNYDDRVLPA